MTKLNWIIGICFLNFILIQPIFAEEIIQDKANKKTDQTTVESSKTEKNDQTLKEKTAEIISNIDPIAEILTSIINTEKKMEKIEYDVEEHHKNEGKETVKNYKIIRSGNKRLTIEKSGQTFLKNKDGYFLFDRANQTERKLVAPKVDSDSGAEVLLQSYQDGSLKFKILEKNSLLTRLEAEDKAENHFVMEILNDLSYISFVQITDKTGKELYKMKQKYISKDGQIIPLEEEISFLKKIGEKEYGYSETKKKYSSVKAGEEMKDDTFLIENARRVHMEKTSK